MVKEVLNKANEKVLSYAEKVLQESRGVRPTYPIEKAIEVMHHSEIFDDYRIFLKQT